MPEAQKKKYIYIYNIFKYRTGQITMTVIPKRESKRDFGGFAILKINLWSDTRRFGRHNFHR